MKTSVGPVILVTTDFYILMSIFSLCKLFFIFRYKFTLERQLGET